MSSTGSVPLPPKPPADSPRARAERFVRLTARVLEQRLFAHEFRKGGAGPMERAPDPALVARSMVTIDALRALRAYGRPVG
ncbi:hypothetical protein [Streptomyces sp. TE5632]